MSKASLENAIRNDVLNFLTTVMGEHYDTDVLDVSASELTMPTVDAEGNEKFVLIKVSIPRGTRNGEGGYTPYDGYAAHDEWVADKQEKADKANARKEKAEREQAEKERKRAARKVVKELNEKGLKQMIAEDPKEEDDHQYLDKEIAV